MTHHIPDSTTFTKDMEHLTDCGFEGMAEAIRILMNEAMKIERSRFLDAGPYERTSKRFGYANGFKPKRIKTRVGEIALEVPKVRGLPEGSEPFYPSSLEKGLRSERALKLAVAYVRARRVDTQGRRDHQATLRDGGQLPASVQGCPVAR